MTKTIAAVLSLLALLPAGAAAQWRGTREAPPVYSHVPCSTPGAKEERPIDLSQQSGPSAKVDNRVNRDSKEAQQRDRVRCVIEGPARTR